MCRSETLLEVLSYLPLRSRVNLSSTCKQLHSLTFNSPTLWRNILFPNDDHTITDEVVANLVPKIIRCDAVKVLTLDGVSLTELGILELLDHFGHSIEHLELSFHHNSSLAMEEQLIERLSRHLEIFVLALGLQQKFDNIPPTFGEYRDNDTGYFRQTYHLLDGYPKIDVNDFVRHFETHGLPTQLDDPPLPQLISVRILSNEPEAYTNNIKKLRVLLAYLAGQDLAKVATIRPPVPPPVPTPVSTPTWTAPHPHYLETTLRPVEARSENTRKYVIDAASPCMPPHF
ncbi:hypothetical protein BC938DRAFT_474159 [Jimgerdemannia flammicorona]|uniref:F-box domain-containing protein n=1 Tax=Jimgerdemannia flammicorona TaxID=994334 RepID=A0A433QSS8_9FUNG|nr:hypothetical protein BC938DRAFT_474159 [Jimgerdemannia flammicorona]